MARQILCAWLRRSQNMTDKTLDGASKATTAAPYRAEREEEAPSRCSINGGHPAASRASGDVA